MYFDVTFETDGGAWCSNIVKAASADAVHHHYTSKYKQVYVSQISDYILESTLRSAKAKGKPVVDITMNAQ